jgi:colicin import membrane protein
MSTQIAEYSATEAGLTELRSRMANVIHDVTTRDGMTAARKDRRECVSLRVALEEIRKREKAPVLERGRLLDTEAKRIEAAILEIETPIDSQIITQEQREEAVRREKAEAEQRRIQKLRDRVAVIARIPLSLVGQPLNVLREMVATMNANEIDEAEFAELTTDAKAARETSLVQVRQMLDGAEKQAADSARLAQERAEFDQQQAAARKKQQEDEAAAKAKRDEEDRVAAAARAEADRVAAAVRKKADDEAAAARKAEADRQAAITAENERIAANLRREEAEKKAQHSREVNAQLVALRKAKPVAQFIKDAIEYRSAPADQAAELLVHIANAYAVALLSKQTLAAGRALA